MSEALAEVAASSQPLEDVIAYVEVRSSDGKANYTDCVKQQLEVLGAVVVAAIGQRCTHVVFKNGKVTTRLRANKSRAVLVNVLWVEKCREMNAKVDERLYPVTDEQQDTPLMLRKARSRFKSLQPGTLEKDVARSEEKLKRKLRKDKKDAFEPWEYKLYNTDVPTPSKLVWPPDHSDVCCTQEIAEYKKLETDLRSVDSDLPECTTEDETETSTMAAPVFSSTPSTSTLPTIASTPAASSTVRKALPTKPDTSTLKKKDKKKLNHDSFFDTTLDVPSPALPRPPRRHRPTKQREVTKTDTYNFVIQATPSAVKPQTKAKAAPEADNVVKSNIPVQSLEADNNIEKLLNYSDELIKDFKEKASPKMRKRIPSGAIPKRAGPSNVERVVYDSPDSLMSTYDASQHYEGLNKTVDDVIELLPHVSPQKRPHVEEISSDDSFDDLWPKKRLNKSVSEMTSSQKEGMFNAFDFDEDDEPAVPKSKKKKKKKVIPAVIGQHYPPIASAPLKISNHPRKLSSAKRAPLDPPLKELEILEITQPEKTAAKVTKFTPSRRLSTITDDLDAMFDSVESQNQIINKSLSKREKEQRNGANSDKQIFDYHDIESPKKKHRSLTRADETICPSEALISLLSNELGEDVDEEVGGDEGALRYQGELDDSDVITKLTYEDSENDGDATNKRSPEKRVRRESNRRDMSGRNRESSGRRDGSREERWSKKKQQDKDDKEWKPKSGSRTSSRQKSRARVVYKTLSDDEVEPLTSPKRVTKRVEKPNKRSSHSSCKKVPELPELEIVTEGNDTLNLGKIGTEATKETPTEVKNKLVEDIITESDITIASPVYEKCYDSVPDTPAPKYSCNTSILFHKNDPRNNSNIIQAYCAQDKNVQEPEISSTSNEDLIKDVPEAVTPVVKDASKPADPPVIDLDSDADAVTVDLEDTSLSSSITEQKPVKRIEKEPVLPRTSSRRSSKIAKIAEVANLKGKEITVVPETPMPKQQSEPTRFFNKKPEKTTSEKKTKITEKPVIPEKTPEDKSASSEVSDRRLSKRSKKVNTKFTSNDYVLNKPVNIFAEFPVEPEKKKRSASCSRTKPSPPEVVDGTKRRSSRQSGSKKTESIPEPAPSKRRSNAESITSDSEVEPEKEKTTTPSKKSSVPAPVPPKRRSRRSTNQDSSVGVEPNEVEPITEKNTSPEKNNVRMGPPSSAPSSTDNNSALSMPPPSSAPPKRKEKKVSESDSPGPLVSKDKVRCSLAEFDLGGLRKGAKLDSSQRAKEELNKSKKVAPLYIVCTTSMHREDQMLVVSAVRNLDQRYIMGSEITADTTHVLVGTPRRTINLLKAIVWGCWIISLDWVPQSVSAEKWLPEEDFVLKEDFPVLKEFKSKQRMRSTAAKLFSSVGPVFVERDTKPPRKDLVELITVCGGQISLTKSRSDVCVGGAAPDRSHHSVTELWILDSISSLKLQKMAEYSLFPYHSPSPEF